MTSGFLDQDRILKGPWQAFERDIARLMIYNGFSGVRVVGGSGDHGADVLGSKSGETWVVQSKLTTNGPPPASAVREVVEAARFYGARRMAVAVSRPVTAGFQAERRRWEELGVSIGLLQPRDLDQYMQAAPLYAPTRATLRPYQQSAANLLRDALVDTGRAQLVLATGLGKTVVMAEVASMLLEEGLLPNRRVLVLAHTRDLIDQLERSFWHQLPKWVHTHRLAGGEFPIHFEGITFATVQSALARQAELPSFDLVFVDEAHHIGADQFRSVIASVGPRMLAGVTATPWRGDGFDIDSILGPPVFQMGIVEGLSQGWLVDVDYRLLADNIDWMLVRNRSRNRYSLNQLNRQLIIPVRDERAAQLILKTMELRKRKAAVVFSPGVEHAEDFAGTLRRYGLSAECVHGNMESRQRERVMARFRDGELKVITTVDLFNEGVDVPDVDMIVFMRATHSRRIFVQQLGRGLRLAPGKDKVIVLDFVSDLRRLAEVLDLERTVRAGAVERLPLGDHLVDFADQGAGSLLREWVLDQADVFLREGDPMVTIPDLNFPPPAPGGAVQ
jgi:superfamily II DNA or RNA helicase